MLERIPRTFRSCHGLSFSEPRVAAAKAGCPSGQRERSVKPSAQPTLVRTQHLPPPAKTPRLLQILALAGRFFSVPACVTLSRCRPSCCGVHGRIADGVRACRAVGDTVGFPRTAMDEPRRRVCSGLTRAGEWSVYPRVPSGGPGMVPGDAG